MGPMVQVMPGPNKPFAQFQDEDMSCRSFAQGQVAGQAQAANNTAVGGAVLSTVIGAGLGAAIGGGRGAAVGAATGAGFGAAAGRGRQQRRAGRHPDAIRQCLFAVHVCARQPGARLCAAAGWLCAGTVRGIGLVQAVQIELNRLGYMRGPADGRPGPQTVNAISSFEASHGLPVDGVASPYLLDNLRQTAAGY